MAVMSNTGSGFSCQEDDFSQIPISVTSPRKTAYEFQPLESEDKDNKVQASWRSLFAFTQKQHTGSIVLAVIAAITSGVPTPIASIVYGKIFSNIAEFGAGVSSAHEALSRISVWCIVLTGLAVAAWATQGLSLSLWMIFGELQAKSVRRLMFEGMLDKDMVWYDTRKDGIASLLVRVQTQIRELQLAVSQPLGFLFTEIAGSFIALGVAFFYSWRLSLVIIATIPVAAGVLAFVSSSLGPAIEAQKRELSRASKHASTSITAINLVKAFNGQDQEVWQYYSVIKEVAAKYLIQARANAFQFGITKFLMIAIFVQGFWYGLILVRHGTNPGHVLTTFYSCLYAMQAVEIILPQWLVLTKGMSAGQTLKSIMVQMQDNRKFTHSQGHLKPERCEGDIEIKEVSFAYPSNPRREVLSKATFFFPAGETTFIVGRSGSGKSTLGDLLMRYYEPLCGEMLLDGRPIDRIDIGWLRQNLTLAQQDSHLFNETVLQNIAFGKRDDATRDEIINAARTGDLGPTILDLPNGLDTVVGSNGKSLSGGQEQRVVIARARLRDAPILMMDESTSALDQTSRERVMKEIREWRKGKTTIIITHDVTQIKNDDYVYVLEKGIVVQEGYRKNLAENTHGSFASFVPVDNIAQTIEEEFFEVDESRRNSEPLSPVTSYPGESPLEDDGKKQLPLPAVFGLGSNQSTPSPNSNTFITPTLRNTTRFSLGVGSQQAVFLKTDKIWHSPVLKDVDSFSAKEYHERGRQNFDSSKFPLVSPQWSLGNGTVVTDSYQKPLPPPPYQKSLADLAYIPFSEHASLAGATRQEPNLATVDRAIEMQHSHTHIPQIKPYLIQDELAELEELMPNSLKQILSTVWPSLVWKDKVILAFGFSNALFVAAATPAFAYAFAHLLSTFYIAMNQSEEARKWALILLGIALGDGISAFSMHYSLEYCGQVWVNSLRVEALKRILAQPKSWFDESKHSASSLTEFLDRNAEEMRNLIGRFAGPVFTVVWMMSISVTWSFILSWKLTLVALSCAPVMVAVTRLFDWVSMKWEARCDQASDITSSIFTETFSNIRVVRAFTLESHFKRKHYQSTLGNYKAGVSRAIYSGFCYGLTDFFSICITALIFYYSTILMTRREISITQALQVVNLLLFSIANSNAMISIVPQVNSSRTTATQMLHLASLPYCHSHESYGTKRLATPFPIEFEDLSFTYPSQKHIKTLSDINLTIEAGTCTALVGPSGSGKSTIASLLLSLYTPDPSPLHKASPLTFSGIPINELNTFSLRNFIAFVPQNPLLFPTTIYQNITYGLPEGSPFSTLKHAQTAAKEAGIHEFIEGLENGYSTLIGDGGLGISGGQRQRICIARALVRKPKLLILDEATSALDAVSADAIRDTISLLMRKSRLGSAGNELMQDALSVVMITHSTEMMRMADEIVVIEEGCIVEQGGFSELVLKEGKFAKLIGLGERKIGGEEKRRVVRNRLKPVTEGRNRESWSRKRSV